MGKCLNKQKSGGESMKVQAIRCTIVIVVFCFGNVFAGFNFSHKTSTVRFGDSGTTATFLLSKDITGWDGTLHKGSDGTLTNAATFSIGFDNGVYENDGVVATMESTYEPGGTYELTLGNDEYIRAEPGQIIESMKISGALTQIEGQPTFNSAIVFDANATLSLGLQSRLNQNLQFDVGGTNTIYLVDDLRLADNVTLVNDCTIDINGKSFEFGGQPLTLNNQIFWDNAGDINLRSKTYLSGTWRFRRNTVINGHGNILDVLGGGILDLRATKTLYLTDIIIKGIDSNTFLFTDPNAAIHMSNVALQFDDDTTFNNGYVLIDGPTDALLPTKNWTFGGTSHLTVSGVTLWKDSNAQTVVGDIIGNLEMVYNGTIKEMSSAGDVSSLAELVNQNSEAIVVHEDEITNNSNAIVNTWDLTVENSEAIVVHETEIDTNATNIVNNSEAIVAIETNVANNSEAIVNTWDLTVDNSNAIIETWDLAYENSQAIVANSLDLIYHNSVAINANREAINANSASIIANSEEIMNNSQAIINNSNAIVEMQDEIELVKQNSEAIIAIEMNVANNSEAIVNTWDLTVENSEAIVVHETEITDNSNAIVAIDTNLTNTYNYLEQEINNNSTSIINNSNAIANLAAGGSVTAVDDLLRFIHGPRDLQFDANTTLTVDMWLSKNHTVTVVNDLTIDGSQHAMTFAMADGTDYLSIADGKNLRFEDTILKDFSPAGINLGTGSGVIFGDGTVIEMSDKEAITNYTMTFDGHVKLNCQDNCLDISTIDKAMDISIGATLEIQNAKINGLGGSGISGINNICCLAPDSTLMLRGCELMLANNFSFTEGFLDVGCEVVINGPENPLGTPLIFSYQSPQQSTIQTRSKLKVDHGVEFSYAPTVASKDLIALNDATSILHLNGCTLHSTTTGMELTTGRVMIEDKVIFRSDAAVAGEAIVFKDPVEVDVLSGGTIDLIDGLLEYQ